ncbi:MULTISPECIES: prepilin-type N-terminal cleavage/methylation domain-containing protein [unclassified Acidisoma]|uniref:prepilin-type N-terminal cleavage/methylation domain-containing protein n=1 Tax=unclassified Acidisoma TaxID=2634065 RepID=UPI00131BC929|nr:MULTISPECIES: prepilin-type N-terminal cleavage/methylation domain-containing protein [unclassified Acidisoma]
MTDRTRKCVFTHSAWKQCGFTLLEVLASLVVLALLVLGLAQGMRFGVAAYDRQTRLTYRQADLDAVDRTLRQLIEQINPGTAHDAPAIAGTPDSFEFTSELPEAAAAWGSRDAEVRLLVDGTNRLLMRWSPYTHALPNTPPAVVDTVLLEQVDHVVFSYWSRSGEAGWRGRWDKAEVPALVRIRIVFRAGSGRAWPDIVAATQRGRP